MDLELSVPAGSAVAVGLIGLLGIPAFRAFGRRFEQGKASYQTLDQPYQDKDGEATEASQKAYSTLIPRSVALIAVIAGVVVAIAQAVLATVGIVSSTATVGSWCRVAGWSLQTFQAITVFLERDYTRRYSLGIHASIASFVTLISCTLATHPLTATIRIGELRTGLLLAQIALSLISLVAFVCIPRRPNIYSDGREVDREMTISLLGRMSFSWAIGLVRKAEKGKPLEYSDLPQLKQRIRAEHLAKRYDGVKKYSKLWKTIFMAFRNAVGLQITIVTIKSFLQFVPQFAMLKILQILESPQEEHQISVWVWVCLLGGVLVINTVFIENWLFWVVWTELGIPIRNMLSSLVFQKSIRRKDVKGVSKKKEPARDVSAEGHPTMNPDGGTPGQNTALPADTVDGVKEDANTEELEQKTRQTTINLVGVDAMRVSMFLTYAYFYPGTIVQITVSLTFLGRLIGTIPLLVGLACFTISIPLNWYASRNYAKVQTTLMDLRDKKLAVANEALQGIRQIKFSALESQWQAKLRERRELELQTLWRGYIFDTMIIACYIGSPNLLMAGALATYAAIYGDLTPSIAFTTVAILTALESALSVLPELTTEGIDAYVSVNRIEEYLNAPEIVDCIESSEQIQFDNASIAWPADDQEPDPDRFILRNLNFSIPPKQLTVVSGKTGSGKSLLLASLLGEIDKLSGTIYAPKAPRPADRYDSKATKGNWIIDSATAFVAQVPWIENATLKDNILFGLPCDEGRYKKTLEACALTKDLEMLDDGDMTEIGHNGVNLSGGQRWRVSFARALYSRAGILVLDDVFSAVDAHVGRQLFEEALTGELAQGRTRVLVTHHVSLVLPRTRYAIYLEDGTAKYAGLVEDLRKEGHLEVIMEDNVSASASTSQDNSDTEVGEQLGSSLSKVMSRRSQRSAVIDDGGIDAKKNTPKKFVEDEKRETGAIKPIVYRTYFYGSGGFWIWIPVLLMYGFTQLLEVGKGWWVTVWTDSYKTQMHATTLLFRPSGVLQHAMHTGNQTSEQPDQSLHNDTVYYLVVYILLSLLAVAFGAVKYFATFVAGLRASRLLFENLTYTVLRTPLRWVDTVPVGRILNRFTADFNTIDSGLAGHMGFAIYKITETTGITGVSFVTSPYMIPLAVILMLSAVYIGARFIAAARPVKRLENNSKSPIFELFGSVLLGIGTVRGYARDEVYIERMWKRIDEYGRSFWNLWLMNRWMSFRFSLIGALFTFCVASVIATADVPASLAGFALAFALNYADAIIWVLRAYATLELDMTAAERVIEFSSLETESQGGNEAPAAWPTKGRLEVEDLVVGYAPDLPPVLKGISFTAESGERVGVVGRTGAGKSSLTLALFRFLEARQGTVSIDGINIASLTLHSLRSRLAIIPQDPVLFSGTVRSNLDPFDQHADHELRDALERVHLVSNSTTRPSTSAGGDGTPTDSNTNIFKSLASRISEGGLNLSQGQRQLLCLARAIVARPRLMVLDEATSAVDKDTDALIQRSIRDEFAGSTLVVIAHRLSTIADFDKILVLGEGRVVEFGSPADLLRRQDGAFREMVAQSGERETLEETILGKKEEGEESK